MLHIEPSRGYSTNCLAVVWVLFIGNSVLFVVRGCLYADLGGVHLSLAWVFDLVYWTRLLNILKRNAMPWRLN